MRGGGPLSSGARFARAGAAVSTRAASVGVRGVGSGARAVGAVGSGTVAVVAVHSRASLRTVFVALFAGIAAFVATAASTPAGGVLAAHSSHHRASRVTATAPTGPVAVPVAPTPGSAADPNTQLTLQRDPTVGSAPAPVSHGVISKLAANGIPSVALNAYRVAALRMANAQPNCGIPWYLLAGIGREESDHGRFHGAKLHADGVSTPKIIGPALDGKSWDYIPAPGNGLALDGDAKYAHALGPMQFIPSTWALYGADADGDGKADIFNINDAALGAARYLCAAGGDLTTTAGQTRAVLTYNHNDQYLAQVLALADAYRKGIKVTGTPIGIVKGSLPTLIDTGYIPPANPASPTAVAKTKAGAPSDTKGKPGEAKGKPGAGTVSKAPGTPVAGRTTAPGKSGTSSDPGSSSTAPAPGGSSSSGGGLVLPILGGGGGKSASASPTPTKPAPSPTPTPTKSCDPVSKLLGLCK